MGAERAELIRLRGLVQGVGMRPTIWRLAQRHHLRGKVWNDGGGVGIHACGAAADLEAFKLALVREAPPLARLDAIEPEPAECLPTDAGFEIADSPRTRGPAQAGVLPDAATCRACRREILDPAARRYRYPFTNCTACGPRLSIIEGIPYDRCATTMHGFGLCHDCRREYGDPGDRRFHAQPIACPQCGPRVWLARAEGAAVAWPEGAIDALAAAARLLQHGCIVAVKGLGGFQLACDAHDEGAVARLRDRKRRAYKPLALMVRDLDQAAQLAELAPLERAALGSAAAPIVLALARRPSPVAANVAPGLTTLGLMLPNTPLHHLLLQEFNGPLVLTSGNLSDEPQLTDNALALSRLASIADHFLLHDRPIARRVDDSVVRVMAGGLRVLRRARGYAPAPIALPPGLGDAPPLLAMGGELKNSFCLVQAGSAVLSHHIGELRSAATFSDYQQALADYLRLLGHAPQAIAVDLHPAYLSSSLGRALAEQHRVTLVEVQHHHAHAAACMAENGWPAGAGPLLAIVFDGLGRGDDGGWWGGEFLLADYRGFRRLGALRAVAMPGGEQAAREPWRNTWAHLLQAAGPAVLVEHADLELTRFLQAQPHSLLRQMIQARVNSPTASSCGRLFDAVAAACGICRERVFYEGQAAMELEALGDGALPCEGGDGESYPFGITQAAGGLWQLEPGPMWCSLLADLRQQAPARQVALRFHRGLALAVARLAQQLCAAPGGPAAGAPIALSGGVFQNRLLLELLLPRLRTLGRPVLTHREVPAGDGGLALGQAVIAAARGMAVS